MAQIGAVDAGRRLSTDRTDGLGGGDRGRNDDGGVGCNEVVQVETSKRRQGR